uniref:SNF2 family N-terminal domain protein n=1 Tax=Pithovirus LCPAC101 TaxID=2506586 RepID=A0A481Z332_9VIRU|nr:MAG: SNF2 family N-terminal domain protein [Pithovirus LCPAC101]
MYKNMDQYMNLIKLGKYTLNKFQERYYRQVLDSAVQDTHIKMPMSSGKTALGIAIALRHPGPAIIVVPPSVLDHWINEFSKIWPNKEDRKFNLYIMHRSKHTKSYNMGLGLDSPGNDDIFLCTSFNSILWKGKANRNANNPGNLFNTIVTHSTPDIDTILSRMKNTNIIAIFDEIHMKNVSARYTYLSPLVSKTVTLSADNKKALNTSDNSSNKIVVGDEVIEDCIPQYELTHEMNARVPVKISKKCISIGMSPQLIGLLYNVYKYVINKKGKTFVFLPSTSIFLGSNPSTSLIKYARILSKAYGVRLKIKEYPAVRDAFGLFMGSRAYTEVYTALNLSHALRHFMSLLGHGDYTILNYDNIKSLNKFESLEDDKSILLSTPTKIQVGININKVSNVLFLITPYKWLTQNIYSQCIGRFRRVNNTRKSIDIHNIIFPISFMPKDFFRYRGLIPLYIEKNRLSFESINLKDIKYVYNMKNYTKSLLIPHTLLDDFKNATRRKSLKLTEWCMNSVDPLTISNFEYLYLMYGTKRVRGRNALALAWLKSRDPTSKYVQ